MLRSRSPKLFIAITSPISTVLLTGQLSYFRNKGYDVSLIAPDDERVKGLARDEGVKHIPVNFIREISPVHDLLTLVSLVRIFIRNKPDILNAGTPKASLLTLFAANLVGVKNKIYTCRGLRYESETGLKRLLLKLIERITSWGADLVICVGPGLKKKALDDKLFKPQKCVVIANGSSNGINLKHFSDNGFEKDVRKLKDELSLKKNDIHIGFVGRLIERKGINELVAAFRILRKSNPGLKLILVGGLDDFQKPLKKVQKIIYEDSSIISIDWVTDVRPYFRLFDLFVLPSYWEGFGNVLLQAAAMGLPIITTEGTGCYDAVEPGGNATVIPVKNVESLVTALNEMVLDREMRESYKKGSIEWVKNFESKLIWQGIDNLYGKILTIN
jgi:glycosyltransferase involved in cell wall biosynthesis